MKNSPNIYKLIRSEKTSAYLMIGFTIISMLLANSRWGEQYFTYWDFSIWNMTLQHWINDGLMSLFFLLVGLELKREFVMGELSNVKIALLPTISALGGVIVPVSIFLLFNQHSILANAAGIPMATDIAFALGALSLLRKTVPTSLRVFLTTLAVIDDLLAILAIAFFYSNTIEYSNLIKGISVLILLIIANQCKIKNLIVYIIGGIIIWYFMLHSGIHATITGVLLAFVIPVNKYNEHSPAKKLQRLLHYPVALIIVPLFALANTGIVFESNWQYGIFTNLGLGIILGLVVGKPLGIILFSKIAVSIGICKLPEEMNWKQIFGSSILAGIGFTMSIFITLLACKDQQHIDIAKISILIASAIAGITGYRFLNSILKNNTQKN